MTAPGTAHRREDGELVGWIRPAGDLWQGIDLLGRPVGDPAEWLEVEAALEERGIAYLADPWMLEGEGERPLRVRLVEVTPERIVVKAEDFGAIDLPGRTWELPWPLPARLRPPRPDDPDAFVLSR
ncbi:hypothetical protein [Microbacterium sp.]|uniref:hypothetical protein n=1 Tax=Microbacterium sp. TaxID=51671 RepID=UPI0039E2C798